MIGGLLRTASVLAIAAAAGVFATSAMAADLGGSCCADLEERVAELEATTARKGTRKVKLTVSGHVNEAVLFWDDGEESNAYVLTNENSRTRFRFVGDAKISAEWSAGYLLEMGVRIANSNRVDQFVDDPTASTAALDLRHSAWWIESSRLGRLWLGLTGMATEGITEINLSNAGVIGINTVADIQGGFFLRREVGEISALSALRWNDIYSQANANVGEGDRRNTVKYVSPTLRGFTFSAAWGEDDMSDVALRYAAEFNGVRVAAGIGYQQATDGNGFDAQMGSTGSQGDRGCADLGFTTSSLGNRNGSDVDCSAIGMSGSVYHVPTGFYVTAAYGKLEDDNREELFARQTPTFGLDKNGVTQQLTSDAVRGVDDEDEHWYLQVGVERNIFGIGKSTFFGEVFQSDTGAGLKSGDVRDVALGDAANPTGPGTLGAGAFIGSSEVDVWGVGFVQAIDAAAMDLYIGFRNYSPDVTLVSTAVVTVTDHSDNNNKKVVATTTRRDVDFEDFQTVLAGGIIRF